MDYRTTFDEIAVKSRQANLCIYSRNIPSAFKRRDIRGREQRSSGTTMRGCTADLRLRSTDLRRRIFIVGSSIYSSTDLRLQGAAQRR
ncbi:hypothetical protein U1Q18_041156 [Sarracenia purpurea var. burkii]